MALVGMEPDIFPQQCLKIKSMKRYKQIERATSMMELPPFLKLWVSNIDRGVISIYSVCLIHSYMHGSVVLPPLGRVELPRTSVSSLCQAQTESEKAKNVTSDFSVKLEVIFLMLWLQKIWVRHLSISVISFNCERTPEKGACLYI